MREDLLADAVLREFLLGRLDEEQREQIERLFFTDSQAREKLLVVEQDLIEDYLEGNLTEVEKKIFLSRYGQTSAQKRQLHIDRSIRDWALREAASSQPSFWARLRGRLALKPAFVIPIAITAMIAVVVAAVWLRGTGEQQDRRLAVEQEMARLNTPAALRESPPDLTSLELSPGSVRTVDAEIEWQKTPDTQLVELRLPWMARERYAKYQAEVSRIGGDEAFTVPNLEAENADGYRIRLRVPAYLFERGHYLIRLTGITPDGASGLTEEYTFAVSE